MKISFKNDYSEGAHPSILNQMLESNLEQQQGYGCDTYTTKEKALIAEKLNNPQSKIYFVSGGTQANLLALGAMLRSYESVITCETSHICDSETGAIEATGHKIHLTPAIDGKIQLDDIREVATCYTNFPHQVVPRLVYISNATELGSIYTLQELKDLYHLCQELNLLLYIDGARLAHALNASGNDITWEDLARYTDAFYIGATKNGAIMGEAIVLNNPELQLGFEYHIKQKGALLAKGRFLGIQFLELFQNNLFNELALHANAQAKRIQDAFIEKGVHFLSHTPTNQVFPILTNEQVALLQKQFDFYIWKKVDETHTAIRLITSWATKPENVDILINAIKKL